MIDPGQHIGTVTPTDPISGRKKSAPKKRWQRDQPVSVLAAQSMRPVEELIGWIEAGKLRAKRSATGEWMVWGSELPKWRELLAETASE